MKYSTLVFDLDGTLLDTSEGIMLGASETARKMGAGKLTIQQQKSFIGPPLLDSFMRECGFSEVEARKAVNLYRKRYKEKGLYEAKHYQHIKELLMACKQTHCKTAVATLKMDTFAKEIIKHFGLSEYFHSVNGIDQQDTHSKADIISMCLKDLDQNDTSKVVMIGDSIYDAMGAEEVGIDFIAVTYGYGFTSKESASQCKNVFIAEDVREIIEFLEL
ncbi:HAD hydrolase-like protein [Bacillus luteolus]|uniref:HAD hydrolase-like protein n=1 Tax=Litchfieldia luteola TaxID=682179 RepID=A0ABR9QFE7_9BACI|nr:HAD hydrolase-like protein [Cytobacillus luteolus]MBE4907222.1 HAD hydrolase-like protein [Cytobacillus luteolus]MBP1943302.1 phosphoglycolate phosphatase [Cytobacillus luteolus]